MKIDITKLTLEEILDLKRQLATVRIGSCGDGGKAHDYESWDWSKSNAALITEHGVSNATVSNYRKWLGHDKVTKHYPACKSWDWTKSDTAIAREQRVDIGVVARYRQRLGKPAAPRDYVSRRNGKLPKINRPDYASLDWNKTDIELSREAGCSRERVRQVRAKLGKPKRYANDKKYDEFVKLFGGRKQLKYSEVRGKFPIVSQTLAHYCIRAGIKRIADRKPAVYPYHLMNWQLPNAVLNEVWGVTTKNIVASRRCNYQLGKPLFWSVNGRIPKAMKGLVEAEKEKAKAYHAKKTQPEMT